MKLLSKIIATGFGTGYSPIAPGTAGAVFILIVYWICPDVSQLSLIMVITIGFFLGVYVSTVTEQEMIEKYGPEKGHDPGVIVFDEIIGQLIAVSFIPKEKWFLAAAFLFFRFFDIVKPFPINRSQKLARGWGIMIDDVIAGIFANVLIQLYLIFGR